DGLTLVVLGGAPAQRQAIEAAARLGVRAVGCGAAPGGGDVRGSGEDLAGIARVARGHDAAGPSAPRPPWAGGGGGAGGGGRGLPHPLDAATAVRATNKIAQREAFDRAGVGQPAWSLEAPPGYPAVVKAPDRQGQRAMTIVADDEAAEAAALVARRASRSG